MKGTLARHAILWMTVFPVLVQALPKCAAFHETGGLSALTKAQLSEGQSAVLNETEALFTCGNCDEPKGIWRIRVSRDGVHDLGHSFLTPEIHWADALLSTIGDEHNASSQATSAVINTLKKNQTGWGMLNSIRIIRRGERGIFEVNTDEGKLLLSYVKHNARPYFTSAKFDSFF